MQKFFVLSLIALCIVVNVFAQKTDKADNKSKPPAQFYLGGSMGFNNESGTIGINLELPIAPKVSLGSGFGGSTWGTKACLETRYYFHPNYKSWAVGAGVAQNTGFHGRKLTVETVNGTKEEVTINGKSVTSAFIAVYKFWKLGRNRNRFYLELGNSVPLSSPKYTVTSGQVLSKQGQDRVRFYSPGGIIFALGFSFAVL